MCFAVYGRVVYGVSFWWVLLLCGGVFVVVFCYHVAHVGDCYGYCCCVFEILMFCIIALFLEVLLIFGVV